MSLYYDPDEEILLQENLKNICTVHRTLELTKVEPTKQERDLIRQHVFSFIKKKKKIIYGGFAYHKLIEKKSNYQDFIYNDLDYPDVEFYTTEFISDIKELCNELRQITDKPIMAEENMHPTTFKVTVNFEIYCDITFTPERFHNSIPTITIDDYIFADPSFLMIDVHKIYNYPLNNFFRLTKTFKRANLLLKYYPFKEISKKIDRNINNPYLPQVYKILKKIETVIFVDIEAYNFYMYSAELESLLLEPPYYVIISTNYSNDVENIYTQFKNIYPEILSNEYYPLMDHHGRHIDFYMEDKDKRRYLARIYDESNRCIPYIEANKIKISTIQGTLFYLLLTKQALMMDKKKLTEKIEIKETMISNLIKAKKAYFEKNNKSEMFQTGPFQEFVLQCVGETVTVKRLSHMQRQERKEKKRPLKYRYEPNESSKQLDQLVLEDFTGSEIKKKENLTLKKLI